MIEIYHAVVVSGEVSPVSPRIQGYLRCSKIDADDDKVRRGLGIHGVCGRDLQRNQLEVNLAEGVL